MTFRHFYTEFPADQYPVKPNVIMCMDVCVLLQPLHQAYVRCAGRVGYNTFEELVDRSEIPAYIEVSADNNFKENTKGGDAIFWEGVFDISSMHAPLPHSFNSRALVVKTPKQAKLEANNHTITFCQRAFANRGFASIRFQQQQNASVASFLDRTPWKNIQYKWDASRGGDATLSLHHGGGAAEEDPLATSSSGSVNSTTALPDAKDVTLPADIFNSMPLPTNDVKLAWQVAEVESIRLVGLDNIVAIEETFMRGYDHLKSIQFVGLKNLKKVGQHFMYECRRLNFIDLTGFESLKVLSPFWIYDCRSLQKLVYHNNGSLRRSEQALFPFCAGLKEVTLTGFHNLIIIKGSFMFDCKSLETITIDSFHSLTTIGDGFMRDCPSLQTLDLSHMVIIQRIGNGFMQNCSSLKSLILPQSLPRLTSIGTDFMDQCIQLESIDLNDLTNMKAFEENFMRGCRSMRSVVITGTDNILSIGDSFMENCGNITTMTFDNLNSLNTIHGKFMKECGNMHTLNLPALPALFSIAEDFLSHCISLESLNLHSGGASNRGRRMTVGSRFCLACFALKTVDSPKLSSLGIVPESFMLSCTSLTKLDMSHMTKVSEFGRNFCCDNAKLETLILPPNLENVTVLGRQFLKNCASLRHGLHLHQMKGLTHVGGEFMVGCPSGDRVVDDAGGDGIPPPLLEALRTRSAETDAAKKRSKGKDGGCVVQ